MSRRCKTDFLRVFLAFCKCAVPAYSNGEDTYENISAKLNIPNKNEYATAITQYTQGEAVRYAYSADVAGAFFAWKTKVCAARTKST